MIDNKDWSRSAEGCKREIRKRINALSGSRSPYEVFCDWVKCYTLVIQNSCDIFRGEAWRKREKEYLQTIRPYGEKGNAFAEMSAILVMAMDAEITDVLGQIYMEAGLGNKNTGQFLPRFTSAGCARRCLWQAVTDPLDTIPTHDRFGLVTIQGVDYQIVDIGLRMLEPRELYGCQGFPDDYIIDHDYLGKSYPRAEQVKRCGNAVCPPIPAALVRANLPELCVAKRIGNIKMSQEETGQLRFA